MKKYVVPKTEIIIVEKAFCLTISGTPANDDPAGGNGMRNPFSNPFVGNPFSNPFGNPFGL